MEDARKVASLAIDQGQEQQGAYSVSTKRAKNSPFCHADGHLSSPNMRSWNRSIKNTKGRVVLRGDIVKNDSGRYAVFTEQGSSASQVTAAKVMEVPARILDCAGQSPTRYLPTPKSSGGCSKVAQNSKKSECPDVWIRLPRHKWPKSVVQHLMIPWFLLSENLYGHPLAGLLLGRPFEKTFYRNWDGKKDQTGIAHLFIQSKDYSYRCTRMTLRRLEESRSWDPSGRL